MSVTYIGAALPVFTRSHASIATVLSLRSMALISVISDLEVRYGSSVLYIL